jgi:hypothetical protein
MGKIITLPPWSAIGRMTLHSYVSVGGNQYDCGPISIASIKAGIGISEDDVIGQNKRDDVINKWSPFHPGSKVVSPTTGLISIPEDTAPFKMDDWIGYMHTADPPSFISMGDVPFYGAGVVEFDVVIDLGEIDWPNDTKGLGSYDYIHIWKENAKGSTYESDWMASAQIGSSSPMIIPCSDTFSAADTSKTYYIWFGSSSAYGSGKGWRPDNNSANIFFDYQKPTYLRNCYFDSTGQDATQHVGDGVYSVDGFNNQSVSKSGSTWYYNAPTIKAYWVNIYPGSGSYQIYTGLADFYARKNGGVWQAISSLQNVYLDNPDYLGSAALPFSCNDYGDYVDIIAIKGGQSFTTGNQGYVTPEMVEPV